MRYEFCTLFDLRYLPRGLVLYRSLSTTCQDFALRVFCMDADTKRVLDAMSLPNLVTIGIDELERRDRELAAVKLERSRTEYYWTATPAICLQVLEREPGLEAITYLDADLMFSADPRPLFDELGDGTALLVPHRYAPEFYRCNVTDGTSAESGGHFNVQLITVRRNPDGLGALRWWRERCLEWCFDRIEPGRYGDQKYLDQWPQLFPGVVELQHPGGGLAPWNVSQYRLERRGSSILVDGRELIFHHYQSLQLHAATPAARRLAGWSSAYRLADGPVPLVWTTGWRPSERELDLLWEPYIRAISEAVSDAREVGGTREAGLDPLRPGAVALRIARRHLPARARRAYRRARETLRRSSPALNRRRRRALRTQPRRPRRRSSRDRAAN